LVEADDHLAGHLERDLRARGVEVTRASNIADAIHTILSVGTDVTVLGIPMPSLDPVACCAALKEGAAPPPLVLLDATGQAAELEVSLPRGMRPDAVLPRPVDSTKLLFEIHQILERVSISDTDAPAGGLHLSLPEILIDLAERAETGILEIRAAGVCTSIHLHQGSPVFAEGGSLQDTLGRLLLRRGKISESEYVRVIERMTETLVDNEPMRMGEVLVEFRGLRRAGAASGREDHQLLSLPALHTLLPPAGSGLGGDPRLRGTAPGSPAPGGLEGALRPRPCGAPAETPFQPISRATDERCRDG
jgi:CheY-like chemotaxis protein